MTPDAAKRRLLEMADEIDLVVLRLERRCGRREERRPAVHRNCRIGPGPGARTHGTFCKLAIVRRDRARELREIADAIGGGA